MAENKKQDEKGIFLSCRAGHNRHDPLREEPDKDEKCIRWVEPEKRRPYSCGQPIVSFKPMGMAWHRIPGPWWDGVADV